MERKDKVRIGSILGKRFKVVQVLGESNHGKIFKAEDRKRHVDVAVKVVNKIFSNLGNEYRALKQMENCPGFPKVFKLGTLGEDSYLVMELLERSLTRMFKVNLFQMSVKDMFLVADQLLTRLEALHGMGMVHGDLTPENLMMGTGHVRKTKGLVYLIDFGLATNYRKKCVSKNNGGALRYISIRVHEGHAKTPRDDLESLAYALAFFLRHENIPWIDEMDEDKVMKMKKSITGSELYAKLPNEFAIFYDKIRSLKHNETPEYKEYRKMLRKCGKLFGLRYDHDWPFCTTSK